MDKDEAKEQLVKVYTFLHLKCVDQNFRLPGGKSNDVIGKFVEMAAKNSIQMNTGWIVDYCLYQVYRWRDYKTKTKFKYNLTWSFGKKAFDSFLNSKIGINFYIDEWLRDDIKISRDDIKSRFYGDYNIHPLSKFIFMESEESTKSRFLNTEHGFLICSCMTTRYAPLSKACSKCSYAKSCANALKKSNPELYRIRNISL